ncbi:hypothetical protein EV363DRAFT_1451122 [Boletus edulis]|nr:hypothetical protein EV363DRAFT_1451122 [Boletus edulis]
MPSRRLPMELERTIFLLVPRKTVHACLRVARRVQVWLQPSLYRVVCLPSEHNARSFVESLEHCPDFALSTVEALCLNVCISPKTAASVLALCSAVKSLNMRFPCHLIGTNPILAPLQLLSCVEMLHVDLSSIFNNARIHLPDVSIFHRVIHLHLTNAWATWQPAASSIGLEELEQITHISLYLSTVRTLPTVLRNILDHKNLAVMVLWRQPFITYSEAKSFLAQSGLEDKRVLVLDQDLFRHHLLDANFWSCAERVIEACEEMEAAPLNGNNDRIMPYIVTPGDLGFHADVEWIVLTDVDSSDSEVGDESGEDL